MSLDHITPPPPLDDAELEQLDIFLREHASNDGLLLDGVHGLLTALAVGPEPALPDEWLAEVLHQPFANAAEGETILDLLARLNDSVPAEIGVDDYEPILGEIEAAPEADGPVLSAGGWCEGFSRGIDLRAGMWETRLLEDPDLMQMLGPIMALALEEGVFSSDAEFEHLSPDDYETCVGQLPTAVATLAQYWRVRPPTERERTADGSASASTFRKPPRRRAGRWVN
ncbi:MAG TPA: YecA family protein [Rhodanobacteraceae bacterium]|nr:YecA family protein [Rhodanobacteraceae bacterium]